MRTSHTQAGIHDATPAIPPTILSATLALLDPEESDSSPVDGAEPRPLNDGTGNRTYRRVKAPAPAVRGPTAVIGPEGGALRLDEHWLIVPGGTVDRDTLFAMERTDDGFLRFDLEALETDQSRAGTGEGDVALRGPVVLVVGFGDATNLDGVEARRITLLYESGDGEEVRPLKTRVIDHLRIALARLDHFSRYCLAYN